MDDSGNDSNSDRSRLVDSIYAGALNPSEYSKVFLAWDAHFERHIFSNGIEDFNWTNEFVAHFERAGAVFDQVVLAPELTVEASLAKLPNAALAMRQDGIIIGANGIAASRWDARAGTDCRTIAIGVDVSQLLREMNHVDEEEGSAQRVQSFQVAMSGDAEPEHIEIIVAESAITRIEEPLVSQGERILVLKSIATSWTGDLQRMIQNTFELSHAETDLVRLLHGGLSIKDVAETRKRSQATIRTQLSAVLHKTGVSNQIGLMRLISSLAHVLEFRPTHKQDKGFSINIRNRHTQRQSVMQVTSKISVQVVESGRLDGHPFYFIQPTTTPQLTPEIVEELWDRKIRLISPVRPGAGQTTLTNTRFTPSDWADVHMRLLEQLGIDRFSCGGHCSGGIYALELASLAKTKCTAVMLVDTGAPLQNLAMFYAMPSAPRRLFLASRYFSRATLTPIKFVAADFASGPRGEDRGVEYFVDGSPVDQLLLRDKKHWKIIRDNMQYCFENVPQLARDVVHWAQDFSSRIKTVTGHSHVRFFHGMDNVMLDTDYIVRFCDRTPNTSYHFVPDSGQQVIYVRPDAFSAQVEEMATYPAADRQLNSSAK